MSIWKLKEDLIFRDAVGANMKRGALFCCSVAVRWYVLLEFHFDFLIFLLFQTQQFQLS